MAKPESTASTEPLPEAENTASSNPEPLPEWSVAFDIWKAWWEVHSYGFAVLFGIITIFCVYCLIKLRRSQSLTLTRYFTAVTGLLLVFSFTRFLYLVLDAYEGHKYLRLPVVLVRIVFAVGYPCLTAIFSLINFAFVKVNNVLLIVKRLQNLKFLSSVIVIHFVFVLIVYLVVTFAPRLARLFILCQVILITWWILLVLAFLYSAWLVKSNQKSKKKHINRSSTTFDDRQGGTESDPTTSEGSKRIINISSLVALAGLVSVALELYSLFGVYQLYDLKRPFVEPWPWWGYQTAARLIEICLCMIIVYIIYPTTKPTKPRSSTVNSMTSVVHHEKRKISRTSTTV